MVGVAFKIEEKRTVFPGAGGPCGGGSDDAHALTPMRTRMIGRVAACTILKNMSTFPSVKSVSIF